MENLEPACKRVAGVRFMTYIMTPLFDTGSEAHPPSNPMATRVHSTREKEPEMLNWLLTSIQSKI